MKYIHALYYFYHLNFTRDKINDKQDIAIIRKKKKRIEQKNMRFILLFIK